MIRKSGFVFPESPNTKRSHYFNEERYDNAIRIVAEKLAADPSSGHDAKPLRKSARIKQHKEGVQAILDLFFEAYANGQ